MLVQLGVGRDAVAGGVKTLDLVPCTLFKQHYGQGFITF